MKKTQWLVSDKIAHVKAALAFTSLNSYAIKNNIPQANIFNWVKAYKEGRLSLGNTVAVSSINKSKVFMVTGKVFSTFERALEYAESLTCKPVIVEYELVKTHKPVTVWK